jgi:hypothetical protein
LHQGYQTGPSIDSETGFEGVVCSIYIYQLHVLSLNNTIQDICHKAFVKLEVFEVKTTAVLQKFS